MIIKTKLTYLDLSEFKLIRTGYSSMGSYLKCYCKDDQVIEVYDQDAVKQFMEIDLSSKSNKNGEIKN